MLWGDFWAGAILMGVALVVLFSFVTTTLTVPKHEAVSRGYALYCPTTGDFAWKGECE